MDTDPNCMEYMGLSNAGGGKTSTSSVCLCVCVCVCVCVCRGSQWWFSTHYWKIKAHMHIHAHTHANTQTPTHTHSLGPWLIYRLTHRFLAERICISLDESISCGSRIVISFMAKKTSLVKWDWKHCNWKEEMHTVTQSLDCSQWRCIHVTPCLKPSLINQNLNKYTLYHINARIWNTISEMRIPKLAISRNECN